MTTPDYPSTAIERLIAEMRERSERMRALSASPPDHDTGARAETEASALEQWATKLESILPALAQEREQLQCKVNMNAAAAVVENERANALQAALATETRKNETLRNAWQTSEQDRAAVLERIASETQARQEAERKHTEVFERHEGLLKSGSVVAPDPAMPRYVCDCLNADTDGRPIDDEHNDTGVYCSRWIVLAEDADAALTAEREARQQAEREREEAQRACAQAVTDIATVSMNQSDLLRAQLTASERERSISDLQVAAFKGDLAASERALSDERARAVADFSELVFKFDASERAQAQAETQRHDALKELTETRGFWRAAKAGRDASEENLRRHAELQGQLRAQITALQKDAASCLCTSEAREHAADVLAQRDALRMALEDCIDSLEYVECHYPGHSGYGVRLARMRAGKLALSAAQARETTTKNDDSTRSTQPDRILGRWYWVLFFEARTAGIPAADASDPQAWFPLKWTESGWSNEDCWTEHAVVIVAWELIPIPTAAAPTDTKG